MNSQIRQILLPVITVFITGVCNLLISQDTLLRPDDADREYMVFFIGNTSSASIHEAAPTLNLLSSKLRSAANNSAVVFLGDFVGEGGMPDSGEAGQEEAEQRLMQLVNVVKDYKGRVVFIPGEQDWGKDKKTGWKSLLRLENFVEKTLNRGNVFLPDNGFPGPQQLKLTDDIRLIA